MIYSESSDVMEVVDEKLSVASPEVPESTRGCFDFSTTLAMVCMFGASLCSLSCMSSGEKLGYNSHQLPSSDSYRWMDGWIS